MNEKELKMDDRVFDAVVLGLGAMGSAALYQLSLRKAAVLGLDQFKPPHEFGSSHGETRITRIACGEGAEYSVFASRSHDIWRDLERKTGKDLLTQNGLLVISGQGQRAANHEKPAFLQTTIDAAEAAGVSYERMTGLEARRRFPAFNLRDDDSVYFDKVGGFVRPEACVQTQLELAEANGAIIRTNEAVTGFAQRGTIVEVQTAQARYKARRLVVAAGAWLPGLLPPGQRAPFTVRRQVLYWFRAKEGSFDGFRPENFPVYIWQLPAPQAIYGFPAVHGPDEGIKLATEQYSSETTPQAVDRTVSREEIEQMYETYVAPYFPALMPAPIKTKVCLYTCVAGARFIIDYHPDNERVILASPCSGHGFKHSAAVGEVLAQMALGETTITLNGAAVDMSRFSLSKAP
jgi:sarcosine oxidase